MNKLRGEKREVDVEMECLVLQYAPIAERLFFRTVRLASYELELGMLIGVPVGLVLASVS